MTATISTYPQHAPIASYKPTDPASGSAVADEAAFTIRTYWTYHNEDSYLRGTWRSGWTSALLLSACIPAWIRYRTPATLGELDAAQSWFAWTATADRIPSFFSPDRIADEVWIPDGQVRAWAHSPPLPTDRQIYRGSRHPHSNDLEAYWAEQHARCRDSRRSIAGVIWNYGPAMRLSLKVHQTMATLGELDQVYQAIANALYLDPPKQGYFQSIAREGDDVKRVLVPGLEPPSWLSGKPDAQTQQEDSPAKEDNQADKV